MQTKLRGWGARLTGSALTAAVLIVAQSGPSTALPARDAVTATVQATSATAAPATAFGFGSISTRRLKSVATGQCVDDSTIGLRHWTCQDRYGKYADFQKFDLIQYIGDTYSIKNRATGLCMDDSSAGLRHFVCHNPSGEYADFQRWTRWKNSDGTYGFKNWATGKCLDDSHGGNLRTWPCHFPDGDFGHFQKFRLDSY
ncbi:MULTISPECIES: RICIN domain-containing protein [Streptomyces]|uniref:RICIN domain-containing protein n=2 Tax=Streptomyces TaxID=1883 RepID=A0ABU4JZG8_9ACTN|nr:RICIN domain-containing protein [Streptomyces roseolus]MDX2290894.1 RICIN domain-containing protein [Streptomyces roseolus]